MRAVGDTNVFVSAAVKDTAWPALIVRWSDGSGGLLKTPATEQEVFEVVRRPRLLRKMYRSLSTDFAEYSLLLNP
jgi:predicted nucleic acid-binding protein